MAQKTTAKKPMNEDPRFAQAVQNYEAGLRAMQERKFEKAKGLLQKSVTGASKELADRISVHLNTCNQHWSARPLSSRARKSTTTMPFR